MNSKVVRAEGYPTPGATCDHFSIDIAHADRIGQDKLNNIHTSVNGNNLAEGFSAVPIRFQLEMSSPQSANSLSNLTAIHPGVS